jgi:Predicted transcriptional regulator
VSPSHPSNRRADLVRLSRSAKAGVIGVGEAASAWGKTRREAALQLARLAREGWLNRVRRGLYYIPALDAGEHVAVEDPWVLAAELFAPSYIGGWSAAEHWGLTEQLFRETFVVTAANIRRREQTALGSPFHLVKVPVERVKSVETVWRGSARVRVSNPERTLVDCFMDPSWAGGVRHLATMLSVYRDSPEASPERLASELIAVGTGAAHKRLGFVAEHVWPEATGLIEIAANGRSAGVIRLDPAVGARGRMNRRWGLWVNATLPSRDA